MYQRHIDTLAEGVCATGMGDPSPGRIAVMTDPDMGGHIIEAVVLDDILGIADNLQNQHITSVRQDKGIGTAVLSIEFDIQSVGVAEHVFLRHRIIVFEIIRR